VKEEVSMPILHIEHPVSSYEAWKKAFDSDPVGREKAGVRRYKILRSAGKPDFVMIDLEFDSSGEAEALLTALRETWKNVEGEIIFEPEATIVELMETKEY
jgi:hypothetical protein